MEDKKLKGAEGAYSSEPQKAHLTGKFVVVIKNGGCGLFVWSLCLQCGQ